MSSASGGTKWKCQHCLAEIPGVVLVPKFCSQCGKEQAEATTPLTCGDPECSNQVSLGSKYCDPCSTKNAVTVKAFNKNGDQANGGNGGQANGGSGGQANSESGDQANGESGDQAYAGGGDEAYSGGGEEDGGGGDQEGGSGQTRQSNVGDGQVS